MRKLLTNLFGVCIKRNRELSTCLISKITDELLQSYTHGPASRAVYQLYSHPRCRNFSTDVSTRIGLSTSPTRLRDFLHEHKISRCFLINLDGELKASHPELEELVKECQEGGVGYDEHEAIFFARGQQTNCLISLFLWRSNRGQGAGGVDLRPIKDLRKLLTDGNKMSKNLGIKQALAGLWASGAKCIISAVDDDDYLDPEFRHKIFEDAGHFLASLNGCMVAGTGLGSSVADMDAMFSRTRYVSNISAYYGGTGPVAESTALGVVAAMEASLDYLDMGSWSGKVVVIQGGGNVGVSIVDQLLQKGAQHIHIAECNRMRVEDIKQIFAQKADDRLTVHKVSYEDTSIFSIPCDIFSPCARGNVIDHTTIPLLDTKIICGASNSPVADVECRKTLKDKKIVYISDVVPNRMGMVKKLLEPYGRMPVDDEIKKQLSKDWEYSIYQTTLKILKLADEKGIDSSDAAYSLGEDLSRYDHPLYPKRVKQILNGLVDSEWHRGKDFWKETNSLFVTPDEF